MPDLRLAHLWSGVPRTGKIRTPACECFPVSLRANLQKLGVTWLALFRVWDLGFIRV